LTNSAKNNLPFCDGFHLDHFHRRCDGHPNTLTVILDTDGNTFGRFTPVEWEPRGVLDTWKADPSLKSFLFTLKNPHNIPARRLPLKGEKKDKAICCVFDYGPHFGDLHVSDNCNANTFSFSSTWFGVHHTNDTGLDGTTFFTGSQYFQVKEIEVFEITNERPLSKNRAGHGAFVKFTPWSSSSS
jgi:hypothetical protein